MAALSLPALAGCLVVALWPAVESLLPKTLRDSIAARAPWWAAAGSWLRSAGAPYALLLLGALSARGYGLMGADGAQWTAGAVAAGTLGLAGGWLASRAGVSPGAEWFRAEARWSMYRAAAFWWSPLSAVAAGAGAVGAAVEFLADAIRARAFPDPAHLLALILRAAASAAVFLIAPNFYLALGMIAAAAAVYRLRRGGVAPSGG
jgi:hypothetical protein